MLIPVIDPRITPLTSLEKIARQVPLAQVEADIASRDSSYPGIASVWRNFQEQAGLYAKARLDPRRLTCKDWVVDCIDRWPQAVDKLAGAMGLIDLFKASDSVEQAEAKGARILALLPLFSVAAASFIPFVGVFWGSLGLIVACTAFVVVGVVHSYFRPCPKDLPKAENWTDLAERGLLTTVPICKKLIDAIASSLIVAKKMAEPVMLTGPAGIGKTEVAKALTLALSRGDYPALQGKTVFYLNMADLANNTEVTISGNRILFHLNQLIGRHRDKVVLILDEFQRSCDPKAEVALSDQLKALFDTVESKFSYILAIATEGDALKGSPFEHRLTMDPLSDFELLYLLQTTLLRESPDIVPAEGALDLLVEKTRAEGNPSSPRVFLSVLRRAVALLQGLLPLPLEEMIHSLKMQKEFLQGSLLTQNASRIEALRDEIAQHETSLQREKETLQKLSHLRAALHIAKTKMLGIASKGLEKASEADQVLFLLLGFYWASALKKRLIEEGGCLDEKTIEAALSGLRGYTDKSPNLV